MKQLEVARIVHYEAVSGNRSEWLLRVLNNMTHVRSADRHTLHELDQALWLIVDTLPDAVVSFFEAWLKKRVSDVEPSRDALPELFGQTFAEYLNAHAAHAQITLTKWFAQSDSHLHWAASDIVHHMSAQPPQAGRTPVLLDNNVLDTLPVEETIFALKKVCGYVVVSGHTLCTLVFSALRRQPVEQAIVTFVVRIFHEYISYSFPNEVSEHLTPLSHGSDTESRCARAILENQAKYYDGLKALPRLKEFEPAASHVRTSHREMNRVMGEALEAGEKKSVLLSAVHKVEQKGGVTTLFQVQGNMFGKTDMAQISMPFTFPRGEFIDPVSAEYMRLMFRIEQREASGESDPS